MEFKTFPELTDILLREQCETSGGYWHKHKLERGRVFSENPSHEQSILPALKKLKVATVNKETHILLN